MSEKSQHTLAEELVNLIEKTDCDSLPDKVVYYTKFFIIDHVGCALAARDLKSSKMIVDTVKELGGREQATVMGYGVKTTMPHAALANAIMAHSLEMDDDHRVACMHPGVPIIPAALAVSESHDRDGKALIASVALGLETMIRAGESFLGVSYNQGFHPTGTCGVFGAAVTTGKLIGLDRQKMLNAIGLAGSQSSGLREARAQGTMGKILQAGHASMCGVLSGLLAQKGFTGPATIFEGNDGFLRAFSYKDTYDANLIREELGERWDMLETSIKVHACCRFLGPLIDCTLDIMRNNAIDVKDIKDVFATSSTTIIRALVEPVERKIKPQTHVDAQFSLPYGIAVAILRKKAFVDEFTDESIKDPDVLAFIPKIRWAVDPVDDANYPDHYSATVTITMNDGKEYKSHIDYPKGDPENPVSKEELEEKFRVLAGKAIGKDKIDALLSCIWNLENLESVRNLTKFLY
jgi:2-methylcitrate dehydratase PrpD